MRIHWNMSATFAFVVVLISVSTQVSVAQNAKNVSINNDSDWWSILRDNSAGETLEPRNQDVASSNFQVLGVALGDELAAIQNRLGQATVVTRGDAGTSRSQVCYVAGDESKTYLNFEIGEVEYAFYLFASEPNWSGSDLCARSKSVTNNLSTASGLRLGQSPAQVKAILGSPTSMMQNGDLIYFRTTKKRTSRSNLKRL